MPGAIWNSLGLIWRAIGGGGGGGLLQDPCPQCCDSDKAWVKACSCVTWDTGGGCGAVPDYVCVYICLAAKLSDDTSKTVAERLSALEAIIAGGGSVIVRDADGYCYRLTDLTTYTTLPGGAIEIAGPGDTLTRHNSCTTGCTARSNGLLYVRVRPCPDTPDTSGAALYICRAQIDVSKTINLNGYGATRCWCADLSDQRDTLPGGAIAVTADGTYDSCCECRKITNAQVCEYQSLRVQNVGSGFTTIARCCCGRPAGMRFIFGTATATETYVDGPNPSGVLSRLYTYTGSYRADANGNPNANGRCQAVLIEVRTVLEDGSVVNSSSVGIVCPSCGGTLLRSAGGMMYVTPPTGMGVPQDNRETVDGTINCTGASGSWSYSGGAPGGLRVASSGSWSYTIAVTQPCANCGA